MKGPRINIPWYRRDIMSIPVDLESVNPLNINSRRPNRNPNNTPQPDLSPEPVPSPSPSPSPNPSTNPNPNPDNTRVKPLPIELPNANPNFPSDQPFPVPKGTPIFVPRTKPAAKPAKSPGRTIPFPRRNPGRTPSRTPAAAIDILEPWPTHVQQPWEIIPVGGLTPIASPQDSKWLDPVIGYAKDVGVNVDQFSTYMIEYDYKNFSVSGMYSDLSGMYGSVVAAILIGYIIASIPLGVPGVPGI